MLYHWNSYGHIRYFYIDTIYNWYWTKRLETDKQTQNEDYSEGSEMCITMKKKLNRVNYAARELFPNSHF